jgi:hypothetical protein
MRGAAAVQLKHVRQGALIVVGADTGGLDGFAGGGAALGIGGLLVLDREGGGADKGALLGGTGGSLEDALASGSDTSWLVSGAISRSAVGRAEIASEAGDLDLLFISKAASGGVTVMDLACGGGSGGGGGWGGSGRGGGGGGGRGFDLGADGSSASDVSSGAVVSLEVLAVEKDALGALLLGCEGSGAIGDEFGDAL